MKKKLLSLISVILIFIGFFLFFQVVTSILPKGKGALQVTSNVKAKVLLNGKEIGATPLCKCEEERIDEGNYTVQIIPDDSSNTYTVKVKVGKNVLTAVDRTFLPGSYASSHTLYLEKILSSEPQLFVSSLPNGALVALDGNDEGVTPLLEKKVSASEHEIELQKGGYGKKTIRVRTVPGYKLIVEAVLGTLPSANEDLPGNEPPVTPTPTGVQISKIKILDTPTGFLRVRANANINSSEIGRVNPGDELLLLAEENGWFQIELPGGDRGWISSGYAQKKGES
jgi:hypothetical protein